VQERLAGLTGHQPLAPHLNWRSYSQASLGACSLQTPCSAMHFSRALPLPYPSSQDSFARLACYPPSPGRMEKHFSRVQAHLPRILAHRAPLRCPLSPSLFLAVRAWGDFIRPTTSSHCHRGGVMGYSTSDRLLSPAYSRDTRHDATYDPRPGWTEPSVPSATASAVPG
jgi:hypothetical protein